MGGDTKKETETETETEMAAADREGRKRARSDSRDPPPNVVKAPDPSLLAPSMERRTLMSNVQAAPLSYEPLACQERETIDYSIKIATEMALNGEAFPDCSLPGGLGQTYGHTQ